MIRPVQISFRGMERSEALVKKIEQEAAELDTYYNHIVNCRVVVETPHQRHEHGNHCQVRIDLALPGGELTIKQDPGLHGARDRNGMDAGPPHIDALLVIHEAFDSARRRLQDYARQQRGEVKTHEAPTQAAVARLFPADDFGFLTTPDGTEIYFHRNSVLNNGFDRLKIGSKVSFVETEGEKGPQASTVKIVRL